MKAIKLECFTRGAKPGDILPVGGKGNIALEDAKILVAEKMATEHTEAVVEAEGDEELKAQVLTLTADLAKCKAEVARLTTERDEAITALELSKGASDGKASTVKK